MSAVFKREEDQKLELAIQISESTSSLFAIIKALSSPNVNIGTLQYELANQVTQLETKVADFISKVFNLPNDTIS